MTDADVAAIVQAPVAAVTREPWPYATSAPLDLISVRTGGRLCEFLLKQCGAAGLLAGARRVKPAEVVDPSREIEVYRRLLAPLGIGPRFAGSKFDLGAGRGWLLIERVEGQPLYEVGDIAVWTRVAATLGRMHATLASLDSEETRAAARLIRYDRAWYQLWIDRARRFFATGDPPSRLGPSALLWLAERYDTVVDRLLALPTSIIHGEFYPSNVLVRETASNLNVSPIDWEMSAAGPRVIDLAALTSGGWTDAERRALVTAYGDASNGGDEIDRMLEDVAHAQIYLAVQWLGWFGRRRPPAAHARDWLADAVAAAEQLRL